MAYLLAFVPVTFVLELLHVSPSLVFVAACLAIVPLAGYMGRATEALALRAGSAFGGLLNATFGNATELIIALIALNAGKAEVVKASLTGSIIGNLLLVLGVSFLAGGWRHQVQTFNAKAAQATASMLVIAIIAFLLPALFDQAVRAIGPGAGAVRLTDAQMSLGLSIVLIALYAANIAFTLFTHRDMLSTSDEEGEADAPHWPVGTALAILAASTVLVGVMSEALVGSLEGFTSSLGLSEFFVGLIVIPIIGNAAEHAAAVTFAMKNKMDLAVTIALGSTIQVALLVAPLLVLASWPMGRPMDLVLHNTLELGALVGAVLIANSVARDGETNWLEGVMLLGVYLMVAIAFYVLPIAGA
ncbi:MAG TPA: calcium/proton exchanger [Deinococcales bacterium]|nr:calcium/proton exchanger [Deinococcales bacterium]